MADLCRIKNIPLVFLFFFSSCITVLFRDSPTKSALDGLRNSILEDTVVMECFVPSFDSFKCNKGAITLLYAYYVHCLMHLKLT